MTRNLVKFIEREFKDGPYRWQTDDQGQWIFQNQAGRLIGVIDRDTHYDLHDIQNKEDKPGKPTMKLTKGKKIVRIKSNGKTQIRTANQGK